MRILRTAKVPGRPGYFKVLTCLVMIADGVVNLCLLPFGRGMMLTANWTSYVLQYERDHRWSER